MAFKAGRGTAAVTHICGHFPVITGPWLMSKKLTRRMFEVQRAGVSEFFLIIF